MPSETRVSYREIQSDGGKKLTGYVAVFNSDSNLIHENGKKFIERISPGSFQRSLKSPIKGDIVAIYSHQENMKPPLGRTSAGTLRLREDDIGLHMELDLPNWASDIAEAVSRRDITGMSFEMYNQKYTWSHRGKTAVGTINDLDLGHVALVMHPCYADAKISVRSFEIPDSNLEIAEKRILVYENKWNGNK